MVADECRHSRMVTRMTQVAGVPTYGPVPWVRAMSNLYGLVTWGPSAYSTILVAEEVLDRLQREQAEDPPRSPRAWRPPLREAGMVEGPDTALRRRAFLVPRRTRRRRAAA